MKDMTTPLSASIAESTTTCIKKVVDKFQSEMLAMEQRLAKLEGMPTSEADSGHCSHYLE